MIADFNILWFKLTELFESKMKTDADYNLNVIII